MRRRTGTGSGCAAPVNHHHRTGNENTPGVDIDEVAPNLQRKGRARFHDQVHTSLKMDLHPGIESIFLTHFFLDVLTGSDRNSSVNLFVLIAFYMLMPVSADLFKLIFLSDVMTLIADRLIKIVLDANVFVSFGVNEDLLFTLLVFNPKLVEAATTL